MKPVRTKINVPLIKEWIRHNDPYGKEKLAEKTFLSLSMVDKIIRYRYYRKMRPLSMQSLCQVLGVDQDTLFPKDTSKTSGYNKRYL